MVMYSGKWNKAAGQGSFEGPSWRDVHHALEAVQTEYKVSIEFHVKQVVASRGERGFKVYAFIDGIAAPYNACGWGPAYPNQAITAPAAFERLMLQVQDRLEVDRQTRQNPLDLWPEDDE